MRKDIIRRGAVAVATVVGLLAMLASPASATTENIDVTGGTLTAAGFEFDLDPEPDPGNPPPCTMPPGNLTATFNANGTWTLAGGWKAQFQLFSGSGLPWYQADFSILAGGGTWVSSPPPANNYALATSVSTPVIFEVRIYALDQTCQKNNLRCIMRVALSFTGSMLTSNPLPDPNVGDQATLDGASVSNISVTSCSFPFALFNGQPATVDDLQLTIV